MFELIIRISGREISRPVDISNVGNVFTAICRELAPGETNPNVDAWALYGPVDPAKRSTGREGSGLITGGQELPSNRELEEAIWGKMEPGYIHNGERLLLQEVSVAGSRHAKIKGYYKTINRGRLAHLPTYSSMLIHPPTPKQWEKIKEFFATTADGMARNEYIREEIGLY